MRQQKGDWQTSAKARKQRRNETTVQELIPQRLVAALFFRDRLKHGLSENLGPKHAQSASAKHEEGQDGNRPSTEGEGCRLSTKEYSSLGAQVIPFLSRMSRSLATLTLAKVVHLLVFTKPKLVQVRSHSLAVKPPNGRTRGSSYSA